MKPASPHSSSDASGEPTDRDARARVSSSDMLRLGKGPPTCPSRWHARKGGVSKAFAALAAQASSVAASVAAGVVEDSRLSSSTRAASVAATLASALPNTTSSAIAPPLTLMRHSSDSSDEDITIGHLAAKLRAAQPPPSVLSPPPPPPPASPVAAAVSSAATAVIFTGAAPLAWAGAGQTPPTVSLPIAPDWHGVILPLFASDAWAEFAAATADGLAALLTHSAALFATADSASARKAEASEVTPDLAAFLLPPPGLERGSSGGLLLTQEHWDALVSQNARRGRTQKEDGAYSAGDSGDTGDASEREEEESSGDDSNSSASASSGRRAARGRAQLRMTRQKQAAESESSSPAASADEGFGPAQEATKSRQRKQRKPSQRPPAAARAAVSRAPPAASAVQRKSRGSGRGALHGANKRGSRGDTDPETSDEDEKETDGDSGSTDASGSQSHIGSRTSDRDTRARVGRCREPPISPPSRAAAASPVAPRPGGAPSRGGPGAASASGRPGEKRPRPAAADIDTTRLPTAGGAAQSVAGAAAAAVDSERAVFTGSASEGPSAARLSSGGAGLGSLGSLTGGLRPRRV